MTYPTWDQIKGMVERFVAVGLAWLVLKGYIGKDDAITYGPPIIILLSMAYAYWTNRPKAIVQSAAALPNTTVVTSPSLAKSTPEANIVSAATNSVEPIPFGETKSTADLNREEIARHQ